MALKLILDFPDFTPKSKLELNQKVFFLGSCFAENIYQKFAELGLQAYCNPLGVVYNPVSIAEQLQSYVRCKKTPSEIQKHHDRYFSWDAAHALSAESEEAYLSFYKKTIEQAHDQLSQAQWVVISLGTSWVYTLADSDKIVANCHKMSSDFFIKKLLSHEQITEALLSIQQSIRTANPQAQILWTISPVRHIRDGLVPNNQSKAGLISALHPSISEDSYYPSYEILIDCLRDYRYYAEDMVHPSAVAVDYIYDHLMQHWLSAEQQSTLAQLQKMAQWQNHRPQHGEKKQNAKIEQLEQSIKRALPDWSPSTK